MNGHNLLLTEDLRSLHGKNIFITGGTGFFGKSLLDRFQKAKEHGIRIRLGVLSRNPQSFVDKFPSLSVGVHFYQGDIVDFVFPEESFDYIIHAGTQASAKMNEESPALMLNSIIDGMRRVLDFSKKCGAKRVLHTSSGAVYGEQPTEVELICEDDRFAPPTNCYKSAYGEGKRVAELMGTIFARDTGIEVMNARCFAFLGPYLPLDMHFAIGNFILNGIRGEDILIKGDGTPRRSYMYSDDLVDWLLAILVRGRNGESYNVGSNISHSIKSVAEHVVKFFPNSKIKILSKPTNDKPKRYVPNIDKVLNEFNLDFEKDLNKIIKKYLHLKI